MFFKKRMEQRNNEMVNAIIEVLPNEFNLISFDYNDKIFGNMIVKIESSNKKYTFVTDRGEIYCNGKMICDSSYRYTENEDTFLKLLSIIKTELK